MNIEETIQHMITEELDRREKSTAMVSVEQFCKEHKISRTTLWRAEREGKLQTSRIGRRVFIKTNQF